MKQAQEMKKLSLEEMEKINAGMKIVPVKSQSVFTPILKLMKKLFGSGKSENR